MERRYRVARPSRDGRNQLRTVSRQISQNGYAGNSVLHVSDVVVYRNRVRPPHELGVQDEISLRTRGIALGATFCHIVEGGFLCGSGTSFERGHQTNEMLYLGDICVVDRVCDAHRGSESLGPLIDHEAVPSLVFGAVVTNLC